MITVAAEIFPVESPAACKLFTYAEFAEIFCVEILFALTDPEEMVFVEIPPVVTFPKVMFAI